MKTTAAILTLLCVALSPSHADVYLHSPRGSNNRNCRNDNNENRRNGNRLFDSQNNNKGGYSCPRSYPFDCYKFADGTTEKANCQAQNQANQVASMINSDPDDPLFGELKNTQAVKNERMFYYVGEILPLEWTAQHGCGENPKGHCDMIIEIGCEDTLTDSLGTIRDGTPINNNDDNNLNDEATTTIPDSNQNGEQDDGRYGRHETLAYYNKCKNRARNDNLWIADQQVQNGKGATATRQNPNANRNGLECKEEVDYYPYWHPTPWKTLAILTSNTSRCEELTSQSQNVMPKHECICADANAEEGVLSSDASCTGNSKLPNNEIACVAKEGAKWVERPAFGVPKPACRAGAFSRDNHLGNAATAGSDPIMMNWTIPEWVMTNNAGLDQFGKEYATGSSRCVLRLRYNLSSADHGALDPEVGFNVPIVADKTLNANEAQNGKKVTPSGQGTPIFDRNNNEEASYQEFLGFGLEGQKLGIATNTNQYGRTFQDRTYTFQVLARNGKDAKGVQVADAIPGKCDGKLLAMGVRGKRGNIVQSYPSVEYDFVPNKMTVTEDDCVHLQWTGSDYNPNRNPNNGEGGPANPNKSNEGKSDRTNMVQTNRLSYNIPVLSSADFSMFDANVEQWKRMTFNDQPLDSATQCLTATELKEAGINNREDRERDNRNCGKLSGQKIPHMNIGVVKAGPTGTYEYMSTRNNNLSNRGQKGTFTVTPSEKSVGLTAGQTVGVVIGSLALVGAAGAGFMAMKKRYASGPHSGSNFGSSSFGALRPISAGGAPSTSESKTITASSLGVVAKHPYAAQEAGELSFKKGDHISVMRKDDSGWWEGECNGKIGAFPSNYVA